MVSLRNVGILDTIGDVSHQKIQMTKEPNQVGLVHEFTTANMWYLCYISYHRKLHPQKHAPKDRKFWMSHKSEETSKTQKHGFNKGLRQEFPTQSAIKTLQNE